MVAEESMKLEALRRQWRGVKPGFRGERSCDNNLVKGGNRLVNRVPSSQLISDYSSEECRSLSKRGLDLPRLSSSSRSRMSTKSLHFPSLRPLHRKLHLHVHFKLQKTNKSEDRERDNKNMSKNRLTRKSSVPESFNFGVSAPEMQKASSFSSAVSAHQLCGMRSGFGVFQDICGEYGADCKEIDLLHDFHEIEGDSSPTFTTEYLIENLAIEEPYWWTSPLSAISTPMTEGTPTPAAAS